MPSRAQKARLGAFLAITAALFFGAVALLAGVSILRSRDEYGVRYQQSVSGLEPGAPVKLRGVRVGRVEGIAVDPDDVETVEVTLSLEPGTPVMRDMRAVVQSLGITGLKFIELEGGTTAAGRLEPGDQITAGESELDALTGRATDIAVKVEALVNNLLHLTDKAQQERVVGIIGDLSGTVAEANRTMTAAADLMTTANDMLAENREAIRVTLARTASVAQHVDRITSHLDDVIEVQGQNLGGAIEEARSAFHAIAEQAATLDVNRSLGAFEQLSWSLRRKVEGADIDGTLRDVRTTAATTRQLLGSVNEQVLRSQDTVASTLENLRTASEYLSDFARSVREDPARLMSTPESRERKLP